MYAVLTRMKRTMAGRMCHPNRMDIARQAAINRTPEPRSRVRKKKRDAVVCVSRPNRAPRN
jgi:hypothetical protein